MNAVLLAARHQYEVSRRFDLWCVACGSDNDFIDHGLCWHPLGARCRQRYLEFARGEHHHILRTVSHWLGLGQP